MGSDSSNANSDNIWIVDYGASRHISVNTSLYMNLIPIYNSNITLPNHIEIPIVRCVDISLSFDIILKDVLLVLGFKTLKVIGRGRRRDDLYVLSRISRKA